MNRSVNILLIVLLITCCQVSFVQAIPRFSVQYGQSCQLCHHNPLGGGMRSLYGVQNPELGPRLTEDSGVEGGIHHLNWDLTIALTNGSSGFVDSDAGKALTGRFAARGSIGAANLNLGYDYLDWDVDWKTGYRYRLKLSSEIYLTGYLELVPALEWNDREEDSHKREYGSGELQLQLWL